jgi:hypothetical protein
MDCESIGIRYDSKDGRRTRNKMSSKKNMNGESISRRLSCPKSQIFTPVMSVAVLAPDMLSLG